MSKSTVFVGINCHMDHCLVPKLTQVNITTYFVAIA